MEEGESLKERYFQAFKDFPVEEKYRLPDQIIRSSRSVNTQIAGGHGKRTTPDRLRFGIIARASLSETLNQMIDSFDCNYINTDVLAEFTLRIKEVEKLLNGYITYLQKKKDD